MNSEEFAKIMDVEKIVNTNRTRKNSKKKGSNYESRLCKQLNERFKTENFSKTPGSGAYATTHSLPDYLKVYGDVITPEGFRFIFDAKKGYNHIGMSDCLDPKSDIRKMLDKVEIDATKAKKSFILVLCQDRRKPVAILSKSVLSPTTTHLATFSFGPYIGILLSDLLSLDDSFFYEEKV
jgi:hypothetical protein